MKKLFSHNRCLTLGVFGRAGRVAAAICLMGIITLPARGQTVAGSPPATAAALQQLKSHQEQLEAQRKSIRVMLNMLGKQQKDLGNTSINKDQQALQSALKGLVQKSELLSKKANTWATDIETNEVSMKLVVKNGSATEAEILDKVKISLAKLDIELLRMQTEHGAIESGLGIVKLESSLQPGDKDKARRLDLTKKEFQKELLAGGAALDEINRGLKEYGSITMSAPLLSGPDIEAFQFNYTHSTTNYFTDAKNHRDVEMAYFEEILSAFAGSLSVQMNPTAVKKYQHDLDEFLRNQERMRAGQELMDGTMRTNFLTQVELALQETNLVTRSTMLTNAVTSYKTYLTTTTNYPTGSTTTNTSSTNGLPPQLELSKYLDNEKLKGFSGLSTNANRAGVANRAALITAAGDQAVEGIFKVLGDPKLAAPFKDKTALFSVISVGVDPGWRTSKDYAANVLMLTEFEYQPARLEVISKFLADSSIPKNLRARLAQDNAIGTDMFRSQTPVDSFAPLPAWLDHDKAIKNKGTASASPIVHAVSPLMETTVMEQEASFRKQQQLALSLAAVLEGAGYGGQANAMYQYAKRIQTDVNGVSSSAAMNAYSAGGGLSGFQVGPRFRAIKNPDKKTKESGFILERQSFPALFIIGFDNDDIRPKLDWQTITNVTQKYVAGQWQSLTNYDVKLVLMEPQFKFTQTSSWRPLKAPGVDPGSRSRMSEEWILGSFYKAQDKFNASLDLVGTLSGMDSWAAFNAREQVKVLDARAEAYRYLVAYNYSSQRVPVSLMFPAEPKQPPQPKAPSITSTKPETIYLPPKDANATPVKIYITIVGDNLESADGNPPILPAGAAKQAKVIGRGKSGLTLEIELEKIESQQLVAKFSFPKAKTQLAEDVNAFSQPIQIKVLEEKKEEEEKNASIAIGLNTPVSNQVETIQVTPNMKLEQLQILKDFRAIKPAAAPAASKTKDGNANADDAKAGKTKTTTTKSESTTTIKQ